MIQKFNFIFTILILSLASSIACKKEESPATTSSEPKNEPAVVAKKTSAVVIFAVGDVHSQERKLALGDVVSDSETLTTGKKSLCDLQILDSDAGIVIRVKADSEFKLTPSVKPDGSDVNLALSKGSGLFKVNNKLSKDQSVNVSLPTMVAGVRGTSFSADISKKGDVGLQVIEGSVASRPAISEIESLPDEVKNNSQAILAVESSLASTEQVIEAGQKITVTKAYTDKVLKDTGLKESLPKIKESIKSGDLAAATQTLDASAGTKEEIKLKITDKVSNIAPIKVEKSNAKDVQTQLKEFEELIAIEKQKMESESSRKTEITARTKEKKESLMKRIEQITGKSAETLILKNGTRVEGVIIQEGDNYHVLTTEGKKSFTESEVEGTEF
jgi:hypothetical protein